MEPFGLIIVAAGVFTVTASIQDWDFFFNSRKAELLVAMLGRSGARVFYGLLGVVIVILGILFTMGMLKDAT
ncbi:MAG: immunity 17 family protein [Planctomycetaceae bacterium]|nr:immunity 17 family protein [Planctomycetaceae bacterium]